MPVQALTQINPQQFFTLSSANGAGTQRLDTKVSGVAVSNDFTGRLSVTTAEGGLAVSRSIVAALSGPFDVEALQDLHRSAGIG